MFYTGFTANSCHQNGLKLHPGEKERDFFTSVHFELFVSFAMQEKKMELFSLSEFMITKDRLKKNRAPLAHAAHVHC